MALYVPGVEETDPQKIIRSQQLIAGVTTTNTTNIASNTTNIATNTTDIATLNALRASSSVFGLAKVDNTTITAAAGVISTVNPLPAPIKASLGADVLLNNAANYFDGPSIAQGSTGTWFVSGTVTLADTVAANYLVKLWDGTTVIASAVATQSLAGLTNPIAAALSGFLATPAGNLRISVRNTADTTGKILFNASGNSKDSTITAYRLA